VFHLISVAILLGAGTERTSAATAGVSRVTKGGDQAWPHAGRDAAHFSHFVVT
jgi:hypothetical protein